MYPALGLTRTCVTCRPACIHPHMRHTPTRVHPPPQCGHPDGLLRLHVMGHPRLLLAGRGAPHEQAHGGGRHWLLWLRCSVPGAVRGEDAGRGCGCGKRAAAAPPYCGGAQCLGGHPSTSPSYAEEATPAPVRPNPLLMQAAAVDISGCWAYGLSGSIPCPGMHLTSRPQSGLAVSRPRSTGWVRVRMQT